MSIIPDWKICLTLIGDTSVVNYEIDTRLEQCVLAGVTVDANPYRSTAAAARRGGDRERPSDVGRGSLSREGIRSWMISNPTNDTNVSASQHSTSPVEAVLCVGDAAGW